jgi:hypothetical protein
MQRSCQGFHSTYLENKDLHELFSDERIVLSLCKRSSLEIPEGLHQSSFKADLDLQLQFLRKGESTEEEFVKICHDAERRSIVVPDASVHPG